MTGAAVIAGTVRGMTHRLRAGLASAQSSSRRSRRTWLGPPVGSPSSGDTATQRSVPDRTRAPSASKCELLHRRAQTLLQVQLRLRLRTLRLHAPVVGRHGEVAGARLPHDEDFVVRARLAGVGHERGVEVQARAEAGHVHAVELGLVERVCKLDEGCLRLCLCRRRLGGGRGRLRGHGRRRGHGGSRRCGGGRRWRRLLHGRGCVAGGEGHRTERYGDEACPVKRCDGFQHGCGCFLPAGSSASASRSTARRPYPYASYGLGMWRGQCCPTFSTVMRLCSAVDAALSCPHERQSDRDQKRLSRVRAPVG